VPILGLSATVPNAEELGKWLGTLNNLPTATVISEWRPTTLHKYFYPYYDKGGEDRIELALEIRDKFPDKPFMYGVFAKTFGRKLERAIADTKRPVAFHNADRDRGEREAIERKFRFGDINDLVATKTLAVGMNLPASHVVVTAAVDGGGEIKAYELNQFAGRAGRPQFETEGHAHFFVPGRDFDYHKNRIENGEPIYSQMRTISDIALHFLGAMYIGRVHNETEFYHWFKRTLRHFQDPIPAMKLKETLASIVDEMEVRGMISWDADTAKLKLRRRGEICAQMGIDPYHAFDLIVNFQKYLAYANPTDTQLAAALGCVSPNFKPLYANSLERNDLPAEVWSACPDHFAISVGTHLLMLKGMEIPPLLRTTAATIRNDIERIGIVLDRLNYECEGWKDPRVADIPYRVYYGVTQDMAFLMAQGCSKAVATKLLKNDVRNVKDLQKNPTLARQLLTPAQIKAMRLKV
jgi:hypothetical protein